MAYMYDMMANPEYGYEDEETRRRRLAEQQAAQQPATAVAPVAPAQVETVPDAAYTAKMESGGNFNIGRHGANTTATGAYGITAPAFQDVQRRDPYFANKSLEQLSPEEQTRAYSVVRQNNAGYLQNFGVEPTDANLRLAHFLGARGAADYIKEGKVSPEAAKFNGGEANVRKIADARLRGQPAPASGAVQPQQQPQQPAAPVAPVAPEAQPQFQLPQFQLAQGQGMPGLRTGAPVAQPQPDVTRTAIDFYQQAQDNPQDLLKLRSDQNAPEWMRRRAADRAYELMDQEVKQRQAQEQVQTLAAGVAAGDPKASREMGKLLTQKEGSWAKFIMLGFISPDLAKEEAIKLGFGNKWQPAQMGEQSGMIEYNAKGMPIRGVKSDGTAMTEKDLVGFAAQGAGGKWTTGAEVFVGPGDKKYYRQSDDKGNIRYVEPGGAVYGGDTGQLRQMSAANALQRMDRQLLLDLSKKHGQNVLDAMKEYEVLNGPMAPEAREQFKQAYGFTMPQAAGAAPAQAAPAAAAASAQAAPAAPAAPSKAQQAAASRPVTPAAPSQINVPLAQQKATSAAQTKASETIAKAAADVVADEAKLINDINGGNRAIDILRTKPNNFGSALQGQFPFGVEQAVGKAIGTEESGNTSDVLEYVDKLTAAGAKALGTNPTDRDLQFLLNNAPNVTTPAARVATWIERVQDRIRANIEIARKQVETGGAYRAEVPQGGGTQQPAAGTTSSGNKYRKVQ